MTGTLEGSKLHSRRRWRALHFLWEEPSHRHLEHADCIHHSCISKHGIRFSLFGRYICHLCCSSLTSTLVVLGSQVLDKLDVLLLGVGCAQVLELGPLVVLCLALQPRESAAATAIVPHALDDLNAP
jgi:uncharacterized metal-binding protein